MINRIHLVILLTYVFLFSVSPSHSQKINVTHCNGACPVYESSMTANRANIVIHHVYAAGINGDSGLADWLSYRLTKEAVGVASLLPRIWNPGSSFRIYWYGRRFRGDFERDTSCRNCSE